MPQTSGSPTSRPTDGPTRVSAAGSRPPWLDAAVRVRLFIVTLVIVGIFGYLGIIREMPAVAGNFVLIWPLAALGFYLGETNVVVVHFLRERHAFSLSELPGRDGPVPPEPDRLRARLRGRGRRRPPARSQPVRRQARLQHRPGLDLRDRGPCRLPRDRRPRPGHGPARLGGRVRVERCHRSPRCRPASRPSSPSRAGRRNSRSCPRCCDSAAWSRWPTPASRCWRSWSSRWTRGRHCCSRCRRRSSSSPTARISASARSTSDSSCCTSPAASCTMHRSSIRRSRRCSSTLARCSGRSARSSSSSRIRTTTARSAPARVGPRARRR